MNKETEDTKQYDCEIKEWEKTFKTVCLIA